MAPRSSGRGGLISSLLAVCFGGRARCAGLLPSNSISHKNRCARSGIGRTSSVFGALLEFVRLGRGLLESVFFSLGFSFLTTSFLLFAPSSKALELRGTSAVTSGGDSTGETG